MSDARFAPPIEIGALTVPVVVALPAHSRVDGSLSYASERPLPPGTLVRVPLGSREMLGVVWIGGGRLADPTDEVEGPPSEVVSATLRPVGGVLEGLPPLTSAWRALVEFAARYYQRGIGEVALAALPPQLRGLGSAQLARRLGRRRKASGDADHDAGAANDPPALTDEQASVLARLENATTGAFLLFGATGSGKTEVYLQAVQRLLQRDPHAQALVMVPEINLTPQLEARFAERFGADRIVSMHSGLTPPQRLAGWLAAHGGRARIVLGTRMAVFASMPRLGLVVVDEEHDPSYKQQEGARYSARDLAVLRGQLEGCRVLLGSATPSLESWHAAQSGKYTLLQMPSRVGAGPLPALRLVDMGREPARTVFSPRLIDALATRVARGEQSLVFLNRRGYAPVLACTACEWKSDCPNCSAYRVFHKVDRSLRCHHCGFAERVPRACPVCGNVDIAPIGRGTEKLEEQLAALLEGARRPDGAAPRIARMDADTTRRKGELEAQLAGVHSGEVDVLVGTQMITKGHDFRRITLVAAVNPDAALFSQDFRAPERLFALLMQAAGRAGRDARHAAASEMWVQTRHPKHPLFQALARHDFQAFAATQLAEREAAAMPPHGFQALLRADAKSQEDAQAFLGAVADAIRPRAAELGVDLYAPVPLTVQRVAGVERAQLLAESRSRPALQRFLAEWRRTIQPARGSGILRWAIDVDPLSI